ncbi:type I-F CRISPR-associated protein Csy1 [Ketobacter sp. MCCC 1A13808]|uniref:type I-F CRISPR-associated protein Csy1 n=1 Tax=Ketobacter sp. MCCC 1A13808 TaxID=2602738 RepID=UPI0012EC32CA|nr:type I-F CRISPR-associated protein Csy1 [Ketobacter sp. MCCC 1A13808]MVF12271.1 type I-F CRISPR-associated protein Csy1 [Ketobacter sp. MCCC 1A13808]
MTSEVASGGLAQLIIEYIKNREVDRLEKFDKETEKKLNSAEPAQFAELKAQTMKAREEEVNKYKPSRWMADAAQRAKQLKFVTHSLKFIHSDAKGTNLYYMAGSGVDSSYIGSMSIHNLEYDVVGNAAALDVGKMLLLDLDGTPVIDFIKRSDPSVFHAIAESESQALEWVDGFSQVFQASEIASHKFAKQIFWPLENNQYHLLMPLYATSFAHEIYRTIRDERFSEESKDAREKRRKSAYSEKPDIRYINTAIQSYGGTKPQNISQLNSQRYGKSYLLSTAPPIWRDQNKPPINIDSIFSRYFERRVYPYLKSIRNILQKYIDRDSNMWMQMARDRGLDDIVSSILNLSASIQMLPAGWTDHAECKLPREEQLWLDPKRQQFDEEFRLEREMGEWQGAVARNFSRWLAGKLETKDMAFGAVEQREFRALIEPELNHNLKSIEGIVL